MFAAYFPSWTGACQSLIIQLPVIGIVTAALFRYAIQRHSKRTVAIVLCAGLATGTCVGLTVGRWFGPWFSPVSFIELFGLQIFASAGAVSAWLLFELTSIARNSLNRST